MSAAMRGMRDTTGLNFLEDTICVIQETVHGVFLKRDFLNILGRDADPGYVNLRPDVSMADMLKGEMLDFYLVVLLHFVKAMREVLPGLIRNGEVTTDAEFRAWRDQFLAPYRLAAQYCGYHNKHNLLSKDGAAWRYLETADTVRTNRRLYNRLRSELTASPQVAKVCGVPKTG